jgi:phosphoglycolate phosphatase
VTANRKGPAPALVLFDIDGTLVRRSGPHHRRALERAVREETGLATTTDGIPVHGMLDPVILAEMMRRAGASDRLIRKAMRGIIRRAEEVYLEGGPSLLRRTCPGARSALKRLQARQIPLGLVTGNLTRIGHEKLSRAGLGGIFQFGAFGEMSKTRTGLAKIAIRQARKMGLAGPGTAISLVGDAPTDIQAAQENGIRSIAVCTGISLREELAGCGPDLLLEDLRKLQMQMLL